jgi:hypothetical protein
MGGKQENTVAIKGLFEGREGGSNDITLTRADITIVSSKPITV